MGLFLATQFLVRKTLHAQYLRIIERLRMTFTANVRYDHVTMFILYLPLAVFSFSVKSSSFALASKARISLHYSHLCTLYFKKT